MSSKNSQPRHSWLELGYCFVGPKLEESSFFRRTKTSQQINNNETISYIVICYIYIYITIYSYFIHYHYHILSYTIIYYHILSYAIIYYHILAYTIIYYHILAYTIIYYHILYILTNRAAVGKSYPAALWSEPYVARPFGHGVRRRDVGSTDHCGCSDGGLCFGEGEHGSSWGYQQKYRCHGHEDGCNQQGRGVFIATHGSRFGPWSSVSKCCVDEELCHL